MTAADIILIFIGIIGLLISFGSLIVAQELLALHIILSYCYLYIGRMRELYENRQIIWDNCISFKSRTNSCI